MTDLLGPASAPNAVTTRVAEYRTFGNVDTWFRPCSSPASQDGTQLQAPVMNGILAQLRGAIRGNGQLASGTGPVVPEVNTVDTLLLGAIQLLIARGQPNAGIDTGTADALAVTPATPWPEYKAGARIWVIKSTAAGPNATAAPSIAVSGLAAVTIVRRDGSALLPGDLPAGVAFCAEHDGTYFRLVSLTWGEIAAAVQSGKWVYGVDKGAADAAVVTLFPVQAPVDGQEILVKLAYANATTSPKINVSGFGTKTIVRQGGGNPAAGDLQPGYLPLVWDATNSFWRVNGLVLSDLFATFPRSTVGNPTLYVDCTNGSDAAGTGTAASPFRTINGALGAAALTLNLTGKTLQIVLAVAGIYAGPVVAVPGIAASIAPAAGLAAGACIIQGVGCISAVGGGSLTIGVTIALFNLSTSASGGAATVVASGGGAVTLGTVTVTGAGNYALYSHLSALPGGSITVNGTITASSGYNNFMSTTGGPITFNVGSGVTLTNGAAFPTFAAAQGSGANISAYQGSVTFSGTNAGNGFSVTNQASIQTNGSAQSTFFPQKSSPSNVSTPNGSYT